MVVVKADVNDVDEAGVIGRGVEQGSPGESQNARAAIEAHVHARIVIAPILHQRGTAGQGEYPRLNRGVTQVDFTEIRQQRHSK